MARLMLVEMERMNRDSRENQRWRATLAHLLLRSPPGTESLPGHLMVGHYEGACGWISEFGGKYSLPDCSLWKTSLNLSLAPTASIMFLGHSWGVCGTRGS